MELALDLRGVAVGYPKRSVLSDISLGVARGEMFGLIGLNGAGKTTLIKAMLDLGTLTAGEIAIMGVPHHRRAARDNLAFLPEQFVPPPLLTGAEFITLSLAFYGEDAPRAEMQAMAESLDLPPDALTRRVTTYSKGMGQKLGLAATLLADRPLLILDEPMSGLDPLARGRLKDALLGYRARGRTVFLSSHILADLDEMCDRVGVIARGGLAFTGAPAELRADTGAATLERAFLAVLDAPKP